MGGVRILEGTYDGTTPAAVMVDGLNDEWTVGPVFRGSEAVEQIEAFQDWMRREPWLANVEAIGLGPVDLPVGGGLSSDPRAWPLSGLKKLLAYWRAQHLDADGYLLDGQS